MSMFDHATGTIITGGVFNAVQSNPDGERQKVLAWVSSIDVLANHSDVSCLRQPGTGTWLLNTKTFEGWQQGTGGAIWCPGMPGAGKTVIASLVIDHLNAHQRCKPVGTVAVAFFYFNYKEESIQTTDAVHLSLIRQLAALSPKLYTVLERSYKEDAKKRPSPQRLIPDMRALTQEFDQVFVVVDALDECADDNRDTFLEILLGLQISGANIFITSRDHVHDSIVHSELVNVQKLDIRGSPDDITLFVKARLIKHRRLAQVIGTRPSLQDEIVRDIVGSCDGMFLMARFHIESLGKYTNAGKIREALKVLPRTFPGIYDEALQRIESDDDHAEEALRVLSFLIHARRQLTLLELQHFIAAQPDDTDFHDEYITHGDILISICAGLVVIDDQAGVVRLVHFTVQEYFDTIRSSKFPLGDEVMGRACLTYLSFDVFKDATNLSDWIHHYALLDYIVHYWHIHVSDHQEALQIPLLALLKDKELLRAYSRFMEVYNPAYFGYSEHKADQAQHTGLHAAAIAGLQSAVSWMMADDASINSKDFTGNTALTYSSDSGFIVIVTLLIANGADIKAYGEWRGTALQRASAGGHEAVVRLLLENGANVHSYREWNGTSLQRASNGGHEAVVRLLLENGADANEDGGEYGGALQRASNGGHEAVVRMLLENGADVNADGRRDGGALQRASNGGHKAVVRLLLENGTDVNANGGRRGTALQKASDGGHEAVVRLLLEKGADVNAYDGRNGTALQRASYGGYEAVVRMLLENGADVNADSGWGGSALQRASGGSHEAIVRLLLDSGADVNADGEEHGTALQRASDGGHEAVVRLLLDKGADVNAYREWNGTSLQRASNGGHEAVVRLLLENGADVNADGGRGGDALQRASNGGHEEVVRLLLENGTDVNANGGRWGTALQKASDGGHEAVVRLLLEKGADVNAYGGRNGTALQRASRWSYEAVVRLLLENGANF